MRWATGCSAVKDASLTLLAEGEQLFRRAHLLLRPGTELSSLFAQTLPQTAGQAAASEPARSLRAA